MPWSLSFWTFQPSYRGKCRLPGIVPLFTIFLLLWAKFSGVKACWGNTAPKYGEMTNDYELRSGSTLVLNCTLRADRLPIDAPEEKKVNVNSTYLFFKKKSRLLSRFVHIIDKLTAQLKIPNATVNDTGTYYCEIVGSELTKEHSSLTVCNSKVNVGYPPKPVSNFRCISMYFENLTCTWDIEENSVQTKYLLQKAHPLAPLYNDPMLQACPKSSSNFTFCVWKDDTDPPYNRDEKILTFVVKGNNSLGTSEQNFTLNHYEFVVPNQPQDLKLVLATKRNLTIRWNPPTRMEFMNGSLPLLYQLFVEEDAHSSSDRKVFVVGVNTHEFTVTDLIPHMEYNVRLRCRSNFTKSEQMWGPFVTLRVKTSPDVPYVVPDIINEAYELHHFDGYRTATLFWKPVPEKHYNGLDFTYRVVNFLGDCDTTSPLTSSKSDVTSLSATFDHLLENSSYCFLLFAVNHIGVSSNHRTIRLAPQKNIPPVPEDITAISHDPGHYVISWKPPKQTAGLEVTGYMVFWCSSLKPWLSRCEGPIQWLNQSIIGHNMTLNLSDTNTNFQFAVVAKTADASSGMHWATCIVPYTAALGKIESIFVEPMNSKSLKVIWKLHCTAQRAVVKKFEIVYCKVNTNKQCQGKKESVDITDPSAESFVLHELHPYSDYRIVIRAYNLAGVPSENSDPKFQRTPPGAPSDPPQHIRAKAMENGTIYITWQPPKEPNGNLTHYDLYINGDQERIPTNGQRHHEKTVNGLAHFTNYTIRLKACVGEDCSPLSTPHFVLTDIGVPGRMEPPRIEAVNSTVVKVSWNAPSDANGPISFYEIQWVSQREENSSSDAKVRSKVVTGTTSTLVELICEEDEDGGVVYAFSVKAANLKDRQILRGALSDSTNARGCFLTQGTAMVIGIAIGGTLALAIAALLIYKLVDWMRDKIHQVKNITVQLPKGLDGPEANPLNNYEQFKNGLLHQNSANKGIERLSYIIEDGDNKNRHGSGSSQYSNSSTDELLLKNGKCTKFGRKASGESSGCSSMSSNTTRSHLSSDSGTESDFHIPPSLDAVFVETNGGHKPSPLPIVMENQDFSKQSCTEAEATDFVPADKPINSLQGGVVLKIDHPYSKFGISCGKSHSALPWWMNPLAFYSYHLANSEPSVMDFDQTTVKRYPQVCAPYSKVGLARSSGDILRISNENPGLGYSKFGIIRHFENSRNDPSCADPEMRSATVGVLMLDANPLVMDYNVLDENSPDSRNVSPYISFKQFTQKKGVRRPEDVVEVDAYTKFGIRDQFPLMSAPDYVTLNDIQVFNKESSPSQSVCPRRSPAVESKTSSQTSSGIESMIDDVPNGVIECENNEEASSSCPIDYVGAEGAPIINGIQSPLSGDDGFICQADTTLRPPRNLDDGKSPKELERNLSNKDKSMYSELRTSDNLKPHNNNQRSSSSPSNGHQSAISETPTIVTTSPPYMPICVASDDVVQKDSPRVQRSEGSVPKDGSPRNIKDLRTLAPPVKNGYVAFTSLLPSIANPETIAKQDPKARKLEYPVPPAQQSNRGSVPANSLLLNVPEETSATNGCVVVNDLDAGVQDSEATDFQSVIPGSPKNSSSEYFVHLLPNVESEICEV